MRAWNVVATLREREFSRGRKFLERLGHVAETGFYNVVVLQAADPRTFLDEFQSAREEDPDGAAAVMGAVPVTVVFQFQNQEEFEVRAKEAAASFIPALGNRSFHVRMHRRGFRGKISGMEEEQFLDRFLKGSLAEAGTPGTVDFSDPDAVLVVETVGTQAGMGLWTREELHTYPLLRVD